MISLITGSSGFLGSNLCNKLNELGRQYVSLSVRENNIEKQIEKIKQLLQNQQVSTIFNIGASQNNLDDVLSLNELIKINTFWIGSIASSIKEFSLNTKLITCGTNWQLSNNGEIEPFNAYAASKAAGLEILRHFAQDKVKIGYAYLTDSYGPNDNRKKLVNLIIDSINNNTPLEMTPGNQVIDLIHINDIVDGIIYLEKELNNFDENRVLERSVSYGKPYSVKEVLNILRKLSNKDDNIKLGYKPYRPRERFNLTYFINKPKGWKPKIMLEDGLSETIKSRKGNPNNNLD